ncbi:hypothetical protein IVG45_05775 [Methylomonas sp. LL1]|uniref:hypothetical protein n=1 Tax=Methylomonas sp. LL1 TaxID=2785785 RepID=UPI0018C3E7D4|nr:hypothetical protein [Methylomonas sp. LL1]QPK64475.1 hypothetical protein IVG45_05775 [Methylomonas sp. LL1]
MKAVIDTNVLLVANGRHPEVSPECVEECIRRLQDMEKSGITVIDDDFRILGEYLNKTHPNQPKGVGDSFLKWLLQNQGNTARVEFVALTETTNDYFAEFPDPSLQRVFDAPDRKFAAVANAHPNKPTVWQAADCKWLDWWQSLQAKGVRVEFLCPADACVFYRKKFPNNPLPELPA